MAAPCSARAWSAPPATNIPPPAEPDLTRAGRGDHLSALAGRELQRLDRWPDPLTQSRRAAADLGLHLHRDRHRRRRRQRRPNPRYPGDGHEFRVPSSTRVRTRCRKWSRPTPSRRIPASRRNRQTPRPTVRAGPSASARSATTASRKAGTTSRCGRSDQSDNRDLTPDTYDWEIDVTVIDEGTAEDGGVAAGHPDRQRPGQPDHQHDGEVQLRRQRQRDPRSTADLRVLARR